ncbi:uncharacterized protein LOC133352544 [Lethenteron reissneri]|uniref:uncharacterized protein LOC133352544 n=1 Tax=Lethenteron reissneri TaxID=7753 RepID=UPI002AB6C1DC|nr:uncharacterized protein LOC133352544 [Lethenteron reissneri]
MDVHNGFLHKYGGFLVKRWRQRYVAVEEDGSLYIARGPGACPRGPIALPSACRAVVPGLEVGSLPPLPTGARPECCLALQLLGGKHVFLLAGDASEFRRWFGILMQARKGVLCPLDGRLTPSAWPADPATRDKQQRRRVAAAASSTSTAASPSPALFRLVYAPRYPRSSPHAAAAAAQPALPPCYHRRHERPCVDLAFLVTVETVAGPALGLVAPGSVASIEGAALRECILGAMGGGGGGGDFVDYDGFEGADFGAFSF